MKTFVYTSKSPNAVVMVYAVTQAAADKKLANMVKNPKKFKLTEK